LNRSVIGSSFCFMRNSLRQTGSVGKSGPPCLTAGEKPMVPCGCRVAMLKRMLDFSVFWGEPRMAGNGVLRTVWNIFVDTFKAFIEHEPFRLAAALSYYSLLSMAPLLLIVIAT